MTSEYNYVGLTHNAILIFFSINCFPNFHLLRYSTSLMMKSLIYVFSLPNPFAKIES